MTVAELIAHLQDLPQDLECVRWNEDDSAYMRTSFPVVVLDTWRQGRPRLPGIRDTFGELIADRAVDIG